MLAADAYRGWSRALPRGAWRPVCTGPTAAATWARLLDHREPSAQAEKCVLPAGVTPAEKPKRR